MEKLLNEFLGETEKKLQKKANIRIVQSTYDRISKILTMDMESDVVVPLVLLDEFKSNIRKKAEFINEVTMEIKYKEIQMEETTLKVYWDYIYDELGGKVAGIKNFINQNSLVIEKDKISIGITAEFMYEKCCEMNLTQVIQSLVKNNLNLDVSVIFENLGQGFERDRYIDEVNNATMNLVKKASQDFVKSDKKTTKSSEPIKRIGIIHGKKVNQEIMPIKHINAESGIVAFRGEVFNIEKRELKSKKWLISVSVTDYTSSILFKIFAQENKYPELDQNINMGDLLLIRGDALYDTFGKEVSVIAKDVMKLQKTIKSDEALEKRVELHAHTKMSAMDGVTSATDLVALAARWGHKSIAITDHGVVQSFPDAMSAGRKNDIKIIYGVEGYLVNDENTFNIKDDQKTIDDTYVVFDLETTGLSSRNNEIIEIGATKIKNRVVIGQYSQLIKPKNSIPTKIQELTGIDNEMVKTAPALEAVLDEFLEFVGDCPVVAHNANFDVSFMKEACKKYDRSFENMALDTIVLAKLLLPRLKRFKLNIVAKELGVSLENHHRAVDDAFATAQIFIKFLELLEKKGIYKLADLNDLAKEAIDIKKYDTHHIIILVKNYTGLKNLYKLISDAHMKYFYKKPRIPKSVLNHFREGLIIGSACQAGELYSAVLKNKSDDEIKEIVGFYDYLEVQPLGHNGFLIDKGIVKDIEELKDINKKIIGLGKQYDKKVVATCDVHYLDSKEAAYRKILMAGQGFKDLEGKAHLYMRTTDEMLKEFDYLSDDEARKIVIENTNAISDLVEEIIPIPDGTFPPSIAGSEEDLREMCFKKAKSIYGEDLPKIVYGRLERELNSIISNGYAVMYIIAQKLVTKSLSDGYLVGSRGSVGSSFAATMSDITEVNPLPPHYICNNCKTSEFILDGSYGCGVDLPDKNCPNCGEVFVKEGYDIPFEVFLGFDGDKEPDIDLNFAGEYQSVAHKYTEELFGKGKVYRAGTIGTIATKTAHGFVRKYCEDHDVVLSKKEQERLSQGCTGVRRTTGQHPGGIMVVPSEKDIFDFCPIQHPANDTTSETITTHFDYHSISGRLLKLDILGHDVPTIIRMIQDMTGIDPQTIPLDQKDVTQLFLDTTTLNILDPDFKYEVGSLGIPEFGTKFVRQMLQATKPSTFSELVRISGLSHGTDVWINNAQDLVKNGVVGLKDVISTRDDIMNYLILNGVPAKNSFKMMEKVRKGKGLTEEDVALLKENDIPNWYIESCQKIKYMFPKAHAVAYVMMSFRIAYFKVHYPLAFYATYFTIKVSEFDADFIRKGKLAILERLSDIESLGNMAVQKEKDQASVFEVIYEMLCRGYEFLPVDIYKSEANKFAIEDGKLRPPLQGLQGLGENAAKAIVAGRAQRKYSSIEDLAKKAKLSKTVIETLSNHGALNDMPKSNQISLF